MIARAQKSLPKILEVKPPKGEIRPLVVDSPHSGHLLPEDFDFACALNDLRQSDEFYVDQFGARVNAAGGFFLHALVSRAYIDLNRSIHDLHPSLCAQTIPWPLTRSKRVNYGIGLIRHLVRANEPVYAHKLTLAEIQKRIRDYYDPYYAALGSLLSDLRDQFGRVLHVNLHGMPSIGADGKILPDIVLGDHDGHSCARIYRETLKAAFEEQGLKVVVNDPYKGVELTKRFAKPRQGIHAIQIEVNKALYMNEETLALNSGMKSILRAFDQVWASLGHLLDEQTVQHRAHFSKAAE